MTHKKRSTEARMRRYPCKDCQKRFDDLTEIVFEDHRQPLKMWVLCLYLMSLNLSNQQIAHELGLNKEMKLGVSRRQSANAVFTHRKRWALSNAWAVTKACLVRWFVQKGQAIRSNQKLPHWFESMDKSGMKTRVRTCTHGSVRGRWGIPPPTRYGFLKL